MTNRKHWTTLYEADAGVPLVWLLTLLALGGLLYPVSVALYYNNVGRQTDSDWVHQLFVRKEAALKLAPTGSRVLVVGGSGCLFSLDASVLEQELHQPVVNLCSHAGVGVAYMLARARRHARAGDTVLLVVEYRVLSLASQGQSNVWWHYFTSWDRRHFLEYDAPEAYKLVYRIPFADIWNSREGWKKLHEGYQDNLRHMYDVISMTPNGNLFESIGHRPPLAPPLEGQFNPPSEYARQLVESFAVWARRNGVRVVSAYQAVALEPSEYWRKTDYSAKIPGWWRSMGIEPQGALEDAIWPSAYFLDSRAHAGPAVAYENAVRIANAMQGKQREARPDKVLLLPPHPSRALLPFPPRQGAAVEIYGGDEGSDGVLRAHLKEGRKVLASTRVLGDRLRTRGFTVKPVLEQFTTPSAVLAENRERIILVCVRPGAPATLRLDEIHGGPAWAGVWHNGRWTIQDGPATAEVTALVASELATGEQLDYRFQIKASSSSCELQTFERDRYPSQALVRMVVIDPNRGVAQGFYDFDSDLRAEVQWQGEVTLK